ncbi:MAG: hypothetical protein LBJ10_09850 [Clostridiales bacterium]|jgi:hypothetical protein|nr:hypothetical protein [Clostridiales bacterium]
MTYAIERLIDEVEARGEARKALETARAMISDGLPVEAASKYSSISACEIRISESMASS